MIVEVVAVGTELLLGQIVNSNAALIGEMLAAAGLDHYHQTVVGDNLERISDVISGAAERADAVIVTGGLGPTQDDLTRDALAAALALPLEMDDRYVAELRARWEARGRPMPESNMKQAEHPVGSELLPNPRGTAPGIRARGLGAWIFAVPGVPAEMKPMVADLIIPFLQEQRGRPSVVVSRVIRTWGESESRIGELLDDLFESPNPTLAFLASSGEIGIRLSAKAASSAGARALIEPIEAVVRERLGDRVFGFDSQTIEAVLLELCGTRGWSLATAESATGGMISARLTSVPGASEVFRGSLVAYATAAKRSLLGVPDDDLAQGAVTEPVALAMAAGAAGALDADVAIAVTGSAGPDPQERPAGTMIVAIQTREGAGAQTLHMPGDRERVRTYTTTAALHLARLAIMGRWSAAGNIWAGTEKRRAD